MYSQILLTRQKKEHRGSLLMPSYFRWLKTALQACVPWD